MLKEFLNNYNIDTPENINTKFFDVRCIDVSKVIKSNTIIEIIESMVEISSNYVNKDKAIKELDNCKNIEKSTISKNVYNLKGFGLKNGYYKAFKNNNNNLWLQRLEIIDKDNIQQVKYTMLRTFKIIIKFTEKGTSNMIVKVKDQQLELM